MSVTAELNDNNMGEAFTELLIPVIELTIPLAAVSFALGLALAVVLALVRIKEVPVSFFRLFGLGISFSFQ